MFPHTSPHRRRRLWAALGLGLAVVGGSLAGAGAASAQTVDTNTWYTLVNRGTGQALEDLGYATNDGAPVAQWSRTGGTNQQWKFVDSGDGNYRLQNRASGKVLDDSGWSKTEGSELGQWSDGNSANQQWKMADSGDGYVRLINRFSGLAAEVPLGAKADGGHIAQYHDWNGTNQQWQLVVADGGGSGGTTGGTGNTGSTGTSTGTGTPVSSSFLGSSTVLIGASMDDTTAASAPFDMRYAYVHSQPAPSSDYYTATRCHDDWSGWWGCWTGSTTAPGTYITYRDTVAAQTTYKSNPRPQKMLWTWYSLRDLGDAAGEGDGPGEVKAINRTDLLTRYLNDYRFFLQKIGTSHDAIDLEPDFWGYVRSLGNPHQVPAQVTSANATDCGWQENSATGLAQCLISMTHKYAPNASVGLHLSCFNWQTDTPGCVKDYGDLGAKNADFLVTDVSDRDAGWYAQPAHGGINSYWTDQKAATALAFYKTMSESVGKPVVLWQIPVGNMAQNNTYQHYQDDKVDWLFSHMNEVADAHVAALLFGSGQGEQTTPETDGGNLVNKTTAYRGSGGVGIR
ncbi:MAG TPA: RICIN domain-containing protein [Streptomyces sp.]